MSAAHCVLGGLMIDASKCALIDWLLLTKRIDYYRQRLEQIEQREKELEARVRQLSMDLEKQKRRLIEKAPSPAGEFTIYEGH